ncbi:solute carrier family 35 member F5-like isoform X4 [Vanacampus margaritifer]
MECMFIMNRMGSPGSSAAAQRRRMALGVVILLLVDVIWVASSELTSYIFRRQEYNKPFFSTFTKTSMFVLYLLGFLLWRPWRQQCTGSLKRRHASLFADAEAYFAPCTNDAAVNNCLWFLANLSYQEALSDTQVAIVNILSSTSGLFTLILAAIFPSNSSDRFTLSKLLAVALSMGGVALVSLSSMERPDDNGTIGKYGHSKPCFHGSDGLRHVACAVAAGSLWSLAGAVLYAIYIVMIKRRVDREDKLDIPMFFGFVGLFNLLLLWPGFLLLHYTGFEAFELPGQLVWTYILVNGLIGTVLSEFLWLWGCFLTSSLIGTLALSLTIPLSILADIYMQKARFSWMFFAGAVPVFLSFFIATLLCHYNNWDPVMVGLRRLYAFVFRRHRIQRLPEDNELCESLIPLHTVSLNQGSFCS